MAYAVAVPVNVGPQPARLAEPPLRVSLLGVTAGSCPGAAVEGDMGDWWYTGVPVGDGAALAWAAGCWLEVATDAWRWVDPDGGLEYMFVYRHRESWVPIAAGGPGPLSLWAPMKADPPAMRRRLAMPLLHPREAAVQFGAVVRDRCASGLHEGRAPSGIDISSQGLLLVSGGQRRPHPVNL